MSAAAPSPVTKPTKEHTKGSWLLWLLVVIAFLILISAWTVLIFIASRNQPVIPETGGVLEHMDGVVALLR